MDAVHATVAATKGCQPTSSLIGLSLECGATVASYLTFKQRGRLLLVNRQLRDEKWGIVKERTYGPTGKSTAKAAKLILRVARSEFGPTRIKDGDSSNAIDSLVGGRHYDLSDFLHEGGFQKSWYTKGEGYDLSKVEQKFEGKWNARRDGEDKMVKVKNELKGFLQNVNALLSNLTAACDYLQGLEVTDATQRPDLYKYLVEDANIPSSYLDRFGENRSSQWGKAGADYDNEPLSYHTQTKGEDGRATTIVHNIDPLFPSNVTIRAVPSAKYKPKALHFRKCVECSDVSYDISSFECPYKWCNEEHKGKCAECAPTTTCSACGKKGCVCCFDSCELCTNNMCNCSDFYGWKDSDRGGAPGCSFVVPKKKEGAELGNDDEEDESWDGDGAKKYCKIHKPEGAVKHQTQVCVIM